MNNFPEASNEADTQNLENKSVEDKAEESKPEALAVTNVEDSIVTIQVFESSEILSIELPLADSHIQKTFEFIQDEPIPVSENKNISQKAEGALMPSVLVDELLLDEIASIPDRFGFKIGDVADLLGIKQYVLRYWEQEFDLLKPKKASNNQRLYTKKDVENAFLIRKLLYRDKFSIEGARQALRDVKFAVRKEKDMTSVIQKLDKSNLAYSSQIKELTKDIQRIKQLFTNNERP